MSKIPCPYCDRPLVEAIAKRSARIVKIVERNEREIVGLEQAVPKSHRVFGCLTCKVFFTTPKKPHFSSEREPQS